MACELDPMVSIPLPTNDEAVLLFDSKLRASVLDTLTKSGVKWTTLGLWRRGREPQTIGQCPPTILITTSDKYHYEQSVWKTVLNNIKKEIEDARGTILVEVVEGTPVTFSGVNVGIPYHKPPLLGESLGVVEEQISKYAESYSGTLGGYLVLKDNPRAQVALTCNHVANPRPFVPEGQSYEYVVHHEMRYPSNQDHEETMRAARAHLLWNGNFEKDRKTMLRELMQKSAQKYVPDSLDQKAFLDRGKIGDMWAKFQDAVWSEDLYVAGSALPTVEELSAIPDTCTMKKPIAVATEQFSAIWKDEMGNAESADYRSAMAFNRSIGSTKTASGLRVWPDPSTVPAGQSPDFCILDWGLVDIVNADGRNISPALQALAAKIVPDSPLAQGQPISGFGTLTAGTVVFKFGRTTGATVGRVNATKTDLSGDVLLKLIGRTDFPNNHKITRTAEWAVSGVDAAIFANQGDSGAWVVNADAKLVGMVFSGLASQSISYISDISVIAQSIKAVTGFDIVFNV